MTFQEALDNLCAKYSIFGFEREFLAELLNNGIGEHEFSVRTAYNGIRMSLAQFTGEHELFSIEDVMEITGESREEILDRIEECREELTAAGENPDDYFVPVESEPEKVTWFFPHGLTS
ncbi:MAG: hypothetical protein ACLTPC_01425 [Lacrimispora saccharolytica]